MKSANKKSGKNQERPAKGRPNEIPEKGQSEHERLDYPHEREQEQQQSGSDTAYSEQAGVTPPKPHISYRCWMAGRIYCCIILSDWGCAYGVL